MFEELPLTMFGEERTATRAKTTWYCMSKDGAA
jgi:hypothetical protein